MPRTNYSIFGERINETNRLKPLIAEARMQNVSQIYRDGVIGEGMTKKLCISCRTVKPFRAHHCSDCAHCVHRFDHHCIWLDNCVGKNNQRAFYLFLFFLTNALLFQWVFSGIFVSAIVKHTSNDDNILKSLLLEPILYCLVANSILNLLWFGFVSYLFIRTSKAMITNLTFYEFLKKPIHVVRRFNGRVKNSGWDLADITPAKIIRNIYAFCSLRDDWDGDDYAEAAEQSALLQAEKRAARGLTRQKPRA
eukprot:GHVP01038941.1.p1 GENE.GHVP01038941.1~~GHVP01038941.1.p1  ORF type:complete len:251 (+),score=14.88 GHVP01038941.1:91-843(+)